MPENKFKIGITQGDTNGIGWEIILKALADPRMTELFTPVVYGSPKAAAYYRNTVAEIEAFSFNPVASAAEARRGKANLVACGETADIAPGKPTPEAGRAAVEALCAAMRDLKAGHLDALVTAPFDKETVQADDFRYTGHTEYLAAELEGEAMMILCSDVLRVGLVTKHIPVSEIARNITKERIVRDLGTLRRALIEDYRAKIKAAEEEIAQHDAVTASLRADAEKRRAELAELAEAKLALEGERSANDRRYRECNELLSQTQAAAGRLEQKRVTAAMEEKQILDKLWESYELSHSAAQEQRIELESVPKASRRINELKREINGLGNVNVGAIEEFDRVNTRYTYLTGQRDDVEKAKEELLGVIENITSEMTVIFKEQFALIRESFQETFLELFGGGKATLELEDENAVLDCGIEIKVQPPGKALKTLSLLSGGEKAFVAIALYFAILKVHPTPFCVMDEIEAALDEPNVIRVAHYMRRICDKTQFIVITHRRGTMEAADVLYGVTMQERGVSKVLTINMNDMAKELNIKG